MCFFALASVLCNTPQRSGAELYKASLDLLFLRALPFIEGVMCTLEWTDFLKSFPVAFEIECSQASAIGVESPECLARHGQNYLSLLRMDSALWQVAEHCGIIILAPSKTTKLLRGFVKWAYSGCQPILATTQPCDLAAPMARIWLKLTAHTVRSAFCRRCRSSAV